MCKTITATPVQVSSLAKATADCIVFRYTNVLEDKDLVHPNTLGFIFIHGTGKYLIFRSEMYLLSICNFVTNTPHRWKGILVAPELVDYFKGRIKFN